jgi:hypothetical protein
MSTSLSQEIEVRKETLMKLSSGKVDSSIDETSSALSSVQVRSLQNRMEALEQQIKKTVTALAHREHYVKALAVDLEHIILQLIHKLDKNANK